MNHHLPRKDGPFSALAHQTAVVEEVGEGGESALAHAARAQLEAIGMRCIRVDQDSARPEKAPDFYCVVAPMDGVLGATLPSSAVAHDRIEWMASAMARSGGGRMALVTSEAGRRVLTHEYAIHASEQAAEIHWWRHLAARYAERGVSINMLALGYAPFAGHTLSDAEESAYLRHLAVRRPTGIDDFGAGLAFLASPDCSAMVGQVLPVTGGLGLHMIPTPGRAVEARRTHSGVSSSTPLRSNPFMLGDQVAVVMGASTGIGRATAMELAARGARVVVVARSSDKLDTLVTDIERGGGRALAVSADVRSRDAIDAVISRTWKEMGVLDTLIYAAGYLPLETGDLGQEGWERTFGVNFDGFVSASRAAITSWIEHRRPGTLLTVSSIGGDLGVIVENLESYGASKAALTQYTRCLARTTARYGIRANSVLPGIVRTPMAAWVDPSYQRCWTAQMPLGRICEPEEIARVIAFLVSPASAYITGEALKVDGGFALGQLPPLLGGQT